MAAQARFYIYESHEAAVRIERHLQQQALRFGQQWQHISNISRCCLDHDLVLPDRSSGAFSQKSTRSDANLYGVAVWFGSVRVLTDKRPTCRLVALRERYLPQPAPQASSDTRASRPHRGFNAPPSRGGVSHKSGGILMRRLQYVLAAFMVIVVTAPVCAQRTGTIRGRV